MATVTLRNNSGKTIPFDASPASARFRFEIETKHGKIINPLNEAPLLSGIEMPPGETRTLEFNVPRLYAVRSTGFYKLQAVVDWNGVSYLSPKVYLEVAPGFELRRIRAGVPDDEHAARTYVLEYLQKESGENLYLRIEDETANLIYGIFNLGQVVRVRMPDLQVDESGNIHVLFQTIGMTFIHTAFTPYGVPLFSESYAGGGKKIEMVRLPNGRISLVGSGIKIPRDSNEASSSSENEPTPRKKE